MEHAIAALAERLERVEARAEITDLVAQYALGADRKNDPEILGPLFSTDATWAAEGFAALVGRAAIAEGLARLARERVLWSIHYMIAPLIRFNSARSATCQWYLWEVCTMQEEQGPQDQWLGGWYDSEVERTAEGWKFTKVVLDVRLQSELQPPLSFRKVLPA